MLSQCWFNAGGPALKQLRFNVSCLDKIIFVLIIYIDDKFMWTTVSICLAVKYIDGGSANFSRPHVSGVGEWGKICNNFTSE